VNFICNRCGFCFSINTFFIQNHNSNTNIECPYCGSWDYRRVELYEHSSQMEDIDNDSGVIKS